MRPWATSPVALLAIPSSSVRPPPQPPPNKASFPIEQTRDRQAPFLGNRSSLVPGVVIHNAMCSNHLHSRWRSEMGRGRDGAVPLPQGWERCRRSCPLSGSPRNTRIAAHPSGGDGDRSVLRNTFSIVSYISSLTFEKTLFPRLMHQKGGGPQNSPPHPHPQTVSRTTPTRFLGSCRKKRKRFVALSIS